MQGSTGGPASSLPSNTIPIDALSNPSTVEVIPKIVNKVVACLTFLLTNIMDTIQALDEHIKQ